MQVLPTEIPAVLEILPRIHRDDRGTFQELFKASAYAGLGLPAFVQDNISWSRRGVLRGLHFQRPPHAQAKLVCVLLGAVLDIAVDIRRHSQTFGRHMARRLSAEDGRQLFIPAGFAHGFCVLSEAALFCYKCSEEYDPSCDCGIRWDDPTLAIPWPDGPRFLSPKDAALPTLEELRTQNRLPA